MIGNLRVHRANYGDVVGVGGGLMEEFADLQTTLAVTMKLERRRKCGTRFAFGQESVGDGLAGVLLQRGLGIEGIDMAGAAVTEELNDSLGLGGEVARLGQQNIGIGSVGGGGVCGKSDVRASPPMPSPVRASSSRRFIIDVGLIGTARSSLIDE